MTSHLEYKSLWFEIFRDNYVIVEFDAEFMRLQTLQVWIANLDSSAEYHIEKTDTMPTWTIFIFSKDQKMILLAYKLTFSWPELVKTVLITFLSKFMRHVQGLKDNEWKSWILRISTLSYVDIFKKIALRRLIMT